MRMYRNKHDDVINITRCDLITLAHHSSENTSARFLVFLWLIVLLLEDKYIVKLLQFKV